MATKSRQDKALAALLSTTSVKEASARSGISEVTFWRYMKDERFRTAYETARKGQLDSALSALQNASSKAVSVLQSIMEDEEGKASTRVIAAKSILGFAIESGVIGKILERIEKLEEALSREKSY